MKILLKISWEALKWEKSFWIDENYVEKLAKKIKKIKDLWNQIWIVIGWGNIYRGSDLIKAWVNPSDSHNMSMLSTVFNWMVLKNFLENIWLKSEVLDPLGINFLENYEKYKAKNLLENWVITIFVWWTWNPYFSTDTAWVLRALEIWADFMIKATKVDWIYTKDPKKYDDAEFLEKVSYDEFLEKNYEIMDQTAVILAKENNLKIKIVELFKENSILNIISWVSEWSEIG